MVPKPKAVTFGPPLPSCLVGKGLIPRAFLAACILTCVFDGDVDGEEMEVLSV